ncbi:conserved exported hypothetical protein [Candidatus Terasakiella magnetica]|nr:conserved exported hypothetical protein [Candidatus Terasakiella magnetica]
MMGKSKMHGIAVVLAAGLIALTAGGDAWAQGAASAPELSYGTAVLQGLDKVTARVVEIEAPVGVPVHFGSLEVIARACKKRRPEDQPESAAFLDIWELRPGAAAAELFRGWMFASSPALSAMEHPVYDVNVLDCRNGGKGR